MLAKIFSMFRPSKRKETFVEQKPYVSNLEQSTFDIEDSKEEVHSFFFEDNIIYMDGDNFKEDNAKASKTIECMNDEEVRRMYNELKK